MFIIEEELKKLPKQPGVYIMHDESDAIIYVGKAVVLYNRVRSYFRESTKKTPKIQQMVKQIAWFEYVVTDSELEALVLENNLIKENQPKYNTMLKDDKTYPFIKVTINEDFPRIFLARKVYKDGARYFGPYTSSDSVRETIELLRKLYKLRNCKMNIHANDKDEDKKCLYYHMGQCGAPCAGMIDKEAYGKNIQASLEFLSGNNKPIINMLTDKMQAASEEMEYEKAMEYRDLIGSVRAVSQKQKITDTAGENKDIIALVRREESVIIQMFFIREGKIVGREHYYMKHVEEENEEDIMAAFLMQFYAGAPYIPKEIVLSCPPAGVDLISEWMSKQNGNKVNITIPQKGKKEKLVELARENANIKLSQDLDKIKREHAKTIGAVKQIADMLGIVDIQRMEAYDISNISGFESVGSMVVFENGKSKPNEYRKFKIKSVEGPNDYASMNEVLTRRFEHGLKERQEKMNNLNSDGAENESSKIIRGKFDVFPDLILMDGGRGQVNICEEVLERLGIDIPVCGMVKDDNHRTRGLYYKNVELPIDRSSEGFHLITRIQDEAHRFAITFHRNLRSKNQVHSILDEIPGVGPARRKALMKNFESLEDVKNASLEDLCNIPSFNMAAAQKVYDFFHSEDDKDS